MNLLLRLPRLDRSLFCNLLSLQEKIGAISLPTLSALAREYSGDQIIKESTRDGFNKIGHLIELGKSGDSKGWQFPTKITDNPNQLTTGFLIEGYGVFLEDFFQLKDLSLAKDFVLAFEETLIIRRPSSPLLPDVIGWMSEEKACFSEGVKRLIDKTLPSD
jgi:hypothetical protein